MRIQKFLALLLCAALLCTAFPVSAAEPAGSFYLVALTAGQTLIEPVAVSYTAGQTLRQALADSAYTFTGIDTAFITAIEGVAGNYTVFYDGCRYDLDQPASEASVLLFSERESCSQALLDLVFALGQFQTRTDHVQNYPAASAAYEKALAGLRSADEAGAQALQQALADAIAAYEAERNGETYTVSCTVQNGTAKSLRLTDAYGNVTQTDGSAAQVVAGEYRFCVSDGAYNRTEGTITVTQDVSFPVTLPTGEWFGNLSLRHTRGEGAFDYPMEQSGANCATCYVEDFRSTVYIHAEMGDVPSQDETALYGCYIGLNGTDYSDGDVRSNKRSWESYQTSLPQLVQAGMEGRDFTLEARYTGADGYVQIQSYAVTLIRTPTLAALSVSGDGSELLTDFSPEQTEYAVTTVSDTLLLSAQAFGTAGYTVRYNGTASASVPVTADTTATVTVSHENGQSRSYLLQIKKEIAVRVTLDVPSGTQIAVYNAAGSEIRPHSDGSYRLIPAKTYRYLATNNTDSHTTAQFTASDGLRVAVCEPETDDKISAAAMYSALKPTNAICYTLAPAFSAAQHSYVLTIPDANSTLYLQADCTDGSSSLLACYQKQTTVISTNGAEIEVPISASVDATQSATRCTQCVAVGGNSNTLTLRAQKTVGAVTYYQDYNFRITRRLSLKRLSLSTESDTLSLMDADGTACSFDRDRTEYRVKVVNSTRSLTLSADFCSTWNETNPNSGGYYAEVNGVRYASLEEIALTLEPTEQTETLAIDVFHEDAGSTPTRYTVTIEKTEPTCVRFSTVPADATVFVVNEQTGRSVARNADGSFFLTPSDRYTYTVTRSGYVGMTQSGYVAPETDAAVSVELARAEENTALQLLPAQWPATRADGYNNGVIDAPTPIAAEDAVLYWATKLGSGYSADACGCPILVGDYLYTYGSDNGVAYLYKVDKLTGQVVASNAMDHKSSFAINSPTYAEGMIFVGLSDGSVQAFDAVTLQSLWLYRDPLGGQPNCPIIYHDGYIYTGFWNREDGDANFVCLSVTDEQPDNELEAKLASWYYTARGGFYWAGAYASDGFVLVGTDDGEAGYITGYSKLLSFDPRSGNLLDSLTLPHTGDLRCSVTFVPDEAGDGAGMAYFTTKGGYFYRLHVRADGTFDTASLKSIKLYNYASDPTKPAMSTSTPTIYQNRAYIGVSGTAQFGAYSGHNITVIDLQTMTIAYSVRTQGYPQTSSVLTTYYDKGDGTVYVYFFDNYTPGKLRVLCDKAGQTEPILTALEISDTGGVQTTYETPPALFTPDGEQAQYAICSPVVDADGTIYFKNDSAYLMAVGSTIDRLEVTEPTKTVYHVGECFDAAGMQVTAVYHNGIRRDVTAAIRYSADPLTTDDSQLQIVFPHVLYQNLGSAVGVVYRAPIGVVNLTVREHIYSEMETNETGHRGVCDYCGAVLEEFEPHSFEWVIDVAPTETETGLKHEECFCGYRRNENTQIPPAEHVHAYTDAVTEPTCTEAGYTTHTCACGDSYVDSYVPALGHDFVHGVCSRCGAEDSCPSAEFDDLDTSRWYHAGVDFVLRNGYMAGTDKGFQPDAALTREMLAQILYAKAGKPAVTITGRFPDEDVNRWYAAAIEWAAENGYIAGYGNGNFGVGDAVTREQIAVILYAYEGKPDVGETTLDSYPDAGQVSGWARTAMVWAVENGLITGNAKGELMPKNAATRATFAVIFYAYLEK